MFANFMVLMATVVTNPSTFDPMAFNGSPPHVVRPLLSLSEPATLVLAITGVALFALNRRARTSVRGRRDDAATNAAAMQGKRAGRTIAQTPKRGAA